LSITTTRRPTRRARLSPGPTDRLLVERLMPLPDVLLVEVAVCGGFAFALVLDRPGWWGAVSGLTAGLVFVAPLAGRSIPRWARARIGLWRNRRRRQETIRWAPFDHEPNDGEPIGFSWDGKILTSMIRVDEPLPSLNVLEPGRAVSGQGVPVAVLADCLRTFDVTLESIDVISQGFRSAGYGDVAAVYDAVLGPLPAIAHRSAWVTVRLDPARCPDAVLARGGGWDGALRTATVATRRVTNRLRDAGLRASTTTASDMVHAATEISRGARLDALQETWTACRDGRIELRSYGMESATCTPEGLGALWMLPSRCTTITLSLRRDEQREAVELRGIVRLDSLGRGRTDHAGMRRLSGRQFDALLCALPLSTPKRPLGHWFTIRDGELGQSLGDLKIPAAGCGQVVGADEHGRAVALSMFGHRVARVELHGTLHLAQQVVLRSLALGARVRVHTRRTGAWREMVEAVGDTTQFMAIGADRGVLEAGARRDFTVEMYDGVPEQPVRVGTTAIVVSPSHSQPSTAADVRLQLRDQDRDEVLVTTPTGSVTVTMVASDDEMRYIGASYDVADLPNSRTWTADGDQPGADWLSRQGQR